VDEGSLVGQTLKPLILTKGVTLQAEFNNLMLHLMLAQKSLMFFTQL